MDSSKLVVAPKHIPSLLCVCVCVSFLFASLTTKKFRCDPYLTTTPVSLSREDFPFSLFFRDQAQSSQSQPPSQQKPNAAKIFALAFLPTKKRGTKQRNGGKRRTFLGRTSPGPTVCTHHIQDLLCCSLSLGVCMLLLLDAALPFSPLFAR